MTKLRPARSIAPMDQHDRARYLLLRPAAVFYGLMFLAGVGVRYLTEGDPLPPPVWPRPAVAAELAIIMLALAFQLALLRWGVRYSRSVAALYEELGEVFRGVPVSVCLLLAVVSGVAEETLFRGALQPLLGAPLATLLFAAVHFPATRRLRVWPLYALVMGAALAALTALSGDILSAVGLHIAVNAISLVAVARATGAQPAGTDRP